MANHTKAKCRKCGKELDTRGIRLHEMKCKGNQDQAVQSEAPKEAQTSGVKSAIQIKKPTAQPQAVAETNKPQPKKGVFWDGVKKMLEDDGDDIL